LPGAIVIANALVSVPPEFEALKETSKVPAAVGVPEIAPVLVLIDNPAGKPVAE
jgi:hypothetical protein